MARAAAQAERGEGIAGLLWWACRRPGRLAASVALVCRGYARRPSLLARALATVPLAASHARFVRLRKVDHVHAHYATYPLLAAWFGHRLTGVPYSVTVHAHDIFIDRSFLARRLAEATFVVAISEYNGQFIRTHGSPGQTPIHVVHCGLEAAAYPFRPRVPSSTGPVRALCIASLQEYKGHRVLLHALADAGERLSRVQLDLVSETGPSAATWRSSSSASASRHACASTGVCPSRPLPISSGRPTCWCCRAWLPATASRKGCRLC